MKSQCVHFWLSETKQLSASNIVVQDQVCLKRPLKITAKGDYIYLKICPVFSIHSITLN